MPEKKPKIVLLFASNLRRLRNEKGYSLRGLSSRCNIDNSDISRMEHGDKNITLKTVGDIAEGLEIDVREFFTPKA